LVDNTNVGFFLHLVAAAWMFVVVLSTYRYIANYQPLSELYTNRNARNVFNLVEPDLVETERLWFVGVHFARKNLYSESGSQVLTYQFLMALGWAAPFLHLFTAFFFQGLGKVVEAFKSEWSNYGRLVASTGRKFRAPFDWYPWVYFRLLLYVTMLWTLGAVLWGIVVAAAGVTGV